MVGMYEGGNITSNNTLLLTLAELYHLIVNCTRKLLTRVTREQN